MNITLEQRVKERTEELAHYIEELEEHNHEIGLLRQMGDLLQACKTVEESYIVIAQSVSQLFPYYSAGLYIFNASRNLLDGVAFWGEKPPEEEMFPPNDCWALRRGRSHVVTDMKTGLKCHHAGEISVSYMCTPMMALGEVLGMLHLRVNQASIKQGLKYFNDSEQQMILNLVDQVGMAIANLRLHEKLRNLSIREILRARRNSSSVGIIMCDLDNFKDFNDTFGHEAGDVLLRELGKFLQSNIRASDIACRLGGEEFVLILPDTLLKMAYQRAEYLREGVKHMHIQHGTQSLGPITLSLGVAMFPDHGPTAGEVLKVADTALYRAKHEGRDRVCGI
jgi:diguanylate cyclase (GGDEF)-like protein